MNPTAEKALAELLRGNKRFRSGATSGQAYTAADFAAHRAGQQPIAAVITCSDSRIAPEIILDQPLGKLLVARVPGNVASESARWMLDIAVSELNVPLVMVVGHIGCRAIQQVLEGKPSVAHFGLQAGIRSSLLRVRATVTHDEYRDLVAENARQTVRELTRDVAVLRAGAENAPAVVSAVYDVGTGEVRLV